MAVTLISDSHARAESIFDPARRVRFSATKEGPDTVARSRPKLPNGRAQPTLALPDAKEDVVSKSARDPWIARFALAHKKISLLTHEDDLPLMMIVKGGLPPRRFPPPWTVENLLGCSLR